MKKIGRNEEECKKEENMEKEIRRDEEKRKEKTVKIWKRWEGKKGREK